MALRALHHQHFQQPCCCSISHGPILMLSPASPCSLPLLSKKTRLGRRLGRLANANVRRSSRLVVRTSSGSLGSRWEEWWKADPGSRLQIASDVTLSDVLWPSAGAFAAMALMGRLDQMIASKGLSFTIAPLGAVCAVLFTSPNSLAAQKHNMFAAQIGCAAFGVLALSMFGPGWLARGTALAASLAFMIVTGVTHPPAASLPLLFIDGAKFHHLNYWYVLFPGALGCVILCLIQEVVNYLKKNCKF